MWYVPAGCKFLFILSLSELSFMNRIIAYICITILVTLTEY